MARAPRSNSRSTGGRRRTRARGPSDDPVFDAEIDAATAQGRPIDMGRAQPNPPRRGRRTAAGPEVPQDEPSAPSAASPVASPAAVVAQITAAGGEGYVKEYELRTLHRLLMRNTRLEVIARAMNKSISEIQRLRRVLYSRLKHEAQNMDMLTHAGRTMAFFGEIRGAALRDATADGVSLMGRMRSYEVAIHAEMGLHKFLQVAGFYSSAKFLPKSDTQDPAQRDADMIQNLMRTVIDPTLDDAAADALMDRIVADRQDANYTDTDTETNLL